MHEENTSKMHLLHLLSLAPTVLFCNKAFHSRQRIIGHWHKGAIERNLKIRLGMCTACAQADLP